MTRDEQWVLEEKYAGDADAAKFAEDCRRLAAGEPAAYVIGYQPFLGLKIYLDSHPLIPRPETEWWTEQMLAESEPTGERPLKVLDLCAGSGAIGCAALKMLPNAQVYFGELDSAHKPTILKNIRENNLDISRADIRIGDLFEPFADMKFDVIATNPPYVPTDRILPPSVTLYEPSFALLAGDDGLDTIRRLAIELPNHLTENGTAWVECDRGHAGETRTLFATQGLRAEVMNDQFALPRIVVVSFK